MEIKVVFEFLILLLIYCTLSNFILLLVFAADTMSSMPFNEDVAFLAANDKNHRLVVFKRDFEVKRQICFPLVAFFRNLFSPLESIWTNRSQRL